MPQGTVAWYDAGKGFGFLTPDDGSPDVFVHVTEVEGGQALQEGEPVAYDVRQGDRGPQAVGVQPLTAPAPAAPVDVGTRGTVTWFAEEKGFGFVALDEGGPDVFVHLSAVEDGLPLRGGDRVALEVREGDRGPQAEQVRLVEDEDAADVVRMTGTVQWFSPEKGFGFLVPDDLFVHGSAVRTPGELQEGERVEFVVRVGERGPQAEQVRVVGAAPGPPAAPAPPARSAGTVARWDGDRGFGFVRPDDGSGDLFVHVSALTGDARDGLQEGERVSFEPVQGPRGMQAADVERDA